ncbi:group 1 truncated hemoglobin [uncultured Aquabacterium sp.]|uniref:group I truncated hemoglobin n=1 Tax=Aquabacterium sp. TaxID=1872578 RepID=UPI0025D36BD4|nr:group 1 truncated hemoglobin [uncultured Aquabacterium sp.]
MRCRPLICIPFCLLVLLSACAAPSRAPLYQRLGGEANLRSFIGRTLDRMASDPRGGRSFDGINMQTLKLNVGNHVCQVADGPCIYDGETMVNAHAQSDIGGTEFDMMVAILREEMVRAGVPQDARNELLRRLAPARRDIVVR